jgi:hypothetical protein
MGVLKIILKYLFFTFIAIQLIIVSIEQKPHNPSLEIKAPKQVMQILQKSCYDCHSYKTNLPWYRYIAPFSWYIKRHVELGRKWLNFSIWQTYDAKTKDKKLEAIYKAVYKAMPLSSYIMFHKDAKLTKQQIQIIRDWTGKAPF